MTAPSHEPLEVFLGFDFYGAGNVGDDLMIAGFLKGLAAKQNYNLTCCIPPERVYAQKQRFPEIRWISASTEERVSLINRSDLWLGVGGTPFQAVGGKWLLKRIVADYESCPNVPKWMIGVGCEKEVVNELEFAKYIVDRTERIWSRDNASRSVLLNELEASEDRVLSGGDLAHIFLEKTMPVSEERDRTGSSLGLIVYGEELSKRDLDAVKSFTAGIRNRFTVTFLANDVRPQKMEHRIYNRIYGGILSPFRRKPGWFAPDYQAADTTELIRHFLMYDTVLSSRYHGLLAAAWAGCKVAVISRSSKLSFLAAELDVPATSGKLTEGGLLNCLGSAKKVSRALLCDRAKAAGESLKHLEESLDELRMQIGRA